MRFNLYIGKILSKKSVHFIFLETRYPGKKRITEDFSNCQCRNEKYFIFVPSVYLFGFYLWYSTTTPPYYYYYYDNESEVDISGYFDIIVRGGGINVGGSSDGTCG